MQQLSTFGATTCEDPVGGGDQENQVWMAVWTLLEEFSLDPFDWSLIEGGDWRYFFLDFLLIILAPLKYSLKDSVVSFTDLS